MVHVNLIITLDAFDYLKEGNFSIYYVVSFSDYQTLSCNKI